MVLRLWCQNEKIMLACKIWVLYIQNQVSYVIFLFVKVMQNFKFTKFWNPEISLKFWDFGPNFCVWPLNIKTKKCYIATWGQKWLLPWFHRGGLWGPPWEPQNSKSEAFQSWTKFCISLECSDQFSFCTVINWMCSFWMKK